MIFILPRNYTGRPGQIMGNCQAMWQPTCFNAQCAFCFHMFVADRVVLDVLHCNIRKKEKHWATAQWDYRDLFFPTHYPEGILCIEGERSLAFLQPILYCGWFTAYQGVALRKALHSPHSTSSPSISRGRADRATSGRVIGAHSTNRSYKGSDIVREYQLQVLREK